MRFVLLQIRACFFSALTFEVLNFFFNIFDYRCLSKLLDFCALTVPVSVVHL